MTTENGLLTTWVLRRHINCLERRLQYLQEAKIAREAEGGTVDLYRAEIFALEAALPIMEAEWDSLARLEHVIRDEGLAMVEAAKHAMVPKKERPLVYDPTAKTDRRTA